MPYMTLKQQVYRWEVLERRAADARAVALDAIRAHHGRVAVRKLARAAGVSATMASQLFRGQGTVSAATAMRIAEHLHACLLPTQGRSVAK